MYTPGIAASLRQALSGQAFLCLSLLASLPGFSFASASDPAILDQIHQAAGDYVNQQLPALEEGSWQITVTRPDKRLKLAHCAGKMHVSSQPLSAGHKVVQVHCDKTTPETANGWRVYVPVTIRQMLPQIIARQSIAPGTVLSRKMLLREEREVPNGRVRHFTAYEPLLGARTKRTISAGSAITPSQICLVCRGDDVTIRLRSGALQIRTYGTALKDGAIGATVSVRNRSSNKTIRARVTGLNEVEVIF